MSKTTIGGFNHYTSLTKSIGKVGVRKSGLVPCMSLKEAADKFDVPVRTLCGWMKSADSPKPRSASPSSFNTYYGAKELTQFIRAKLASLKTEA